MEALNGPASVGVAGITPWDTAGARTTTRHLVA
ncbi:hypothetical protein ACVWWN_005614 [Mycobacterium sp. URHB0021]|jgi:hypothetical protein